MSQVDFNFQNFRLLAVLVIILSNSIFSKVISYLLMSRQNCKSLMVNCLVFLLKNSKLYTRFAIYQCYRSNIKWILSKPRSGIFDGRKTKTLQTSVIYVSSTHSHANNVLPLTQRSNLRNIYCCKIC